MNSKKFREIVRRAKNVRVLEDKLLPPLKKEGITFESQREFANYVRDSWEDAGYQIHRSELESMQPINLDELPFRKVTVDGIDFYVHGLVHAGFGGLEVQPRLKNYVREKAVEFASKPSSDYCCEEMFDKWFGLDSSKMMYDHDASFFKLSKEELDEIERGYQMADNLAAKTKSKLDLEEKPREISFHNMFERGHTDERYLRFFEVWQEKVSDMPMPLEAEIYMAAGAADKATVLRSAYMALWARSRAQSEGLKEMHIFQGFNHVNQTGYYLTRIQLQQR